MVNFVNGALLINRGDTMVNYVNGVLVVRAECGNTKPKIYDKAIRLCNFNKT